MLFKTDTLFGHVIEDTPQGPIYQDDRSLVTKENLRPCLGCAAKCASGAQDPCITNLPETVNACCGHGLELRPVSKRPSGYVALKDGRTIQFSGLCGGKRIRAAVACALAGKPLPEGFAYDEQTGKPWWTDLSAAQRTYVLSRVPQVQIELVREVKGSVAAAVLSGEQLWHYGLTDDEKHYVLRRLAVKLAEMREEALMQA